MSTLPVATQRKIQSRGDSTDPAFQKPKTGKTIQNSSFEYDKEKYLTEGVGNACVDFGAGKKRKPKQSHLATEALRPLPQSIFDSPVCWQPERQDLSNLHAADCSEEK